MALLKERPTKIRKLDSGLDGDKVAEFAFGIQDGSLKTSTVGPSANQALNVFSSSPNEDSAAPVSQICDTEVSQPLSKNQLKKLRRKKEWEDGREYRKTKRREKIKAKKIRKAELRINADLNATENAPVSPYSSQRKNGQRPAQLPVTIILDCDFDELMTESEMISLGSQLTRCYSDNKTALYRAHLIISSFSGKLKHRFETVLASNHLGWKGVKFTADDFSTAAKEADSMMRGPQGGRLLGAFAGREDTERPLQQPSPQATTEAQSSAVISDRSPSPSVTATELARPEIEQVSADDKVAISAVPPFSMDTLVTDKPSQKLDSALPENIDAEVNNRPMNLSRKPDIVYLTSDSPHTLDALSPYTTYIIGGLVDKNRHKGICYKRAMERDIPTAKLPIGEYMTMQSRSVLATNHVAEIMLKWLECGDWAEAFLQVIPKRKEAKLKAVENKGNDLENEDDRSGSSSAQEE